MTNLTTTTETQKLKISATVTEKKSVEREINLPYFCKLSDTFYKVANENSVLKVDPSDSYTCVIKLGLWLIKDDILKAEQTTEENFNEAYETAFTNIKTA